MLHRSDLTEVDVVTLLPLLARQKNTSLAIKLLEGLQSRNLASFDSLYSCVYFIQSHQRPEANGFQGLAMGKQEPPPDPVWPIPQAPLPP